MTSLGDQSQDFLFSLGELGQRIHLTAASEEPRDDRRIDHGFAINDAPQRIYNGCHVEHPLLEEISHSLRMLFHKAHRVTGFHVLGENKNTDFRVLGSDRLRGDEAFIRMRGRHPNINDRDVWPIQSDVANQPVGVFCLADHVDARILQQVDYSFAGKQDIVCNHYVAWNLRP